MIKCDGHSTMLSGTIFDTMQDFVNVIASMRKSLQEHFEPEVADKIIAVCGELAFAVSDGNKEQEEEAYRAMLEVIGSE